MLEPLSGFIDVCFLLGRFQLTFVPPWQPFVHLTYKESLEQEVQVHIPNKNTESNKYTKGVLNLPHSTRSVFIADNDIYPQ